MEHSLAPYLPGGRARKSHMKRFRVTRFSLDTRPNILSKEIDADWDEAVKKLWRESKRTIREGLREQYGSRKVEQKIQNFIDLGSEPISVIAFHNKFLAQIRSSFVVGGYYPALTAACALGERILNHLVLRLRKHFKDTPKYKKVYRKKSFDNWSLAIDTLDSWGVLLPTVVEWYYELEVARHQALHFNPDTDTNDRALALEAIQLLQDIIQEQFGAFGTQPWFIEGTSGAAYIKKEFESDPFIREVYLPNATRVGPDHRVEKVGEGKLRIVDDRDYEESEITDEEFRKLLEE